MNAEFAWFLFWRTGLPFVTAYQRCAQKGNTVTRRFAARDFRLFQDGKAIGTTPLRRLFAPERA
jgi:hypothetical protein